jgi:hypothetical protein
LNNFEGVAQLSLFLGQFEDYSHTSHPKEFFGVVMVPFYSMERAVEYPVGLCSDFERGKGLFAFEASG